MQSGGRPVEGAASPGRRGARRAYLVAVIIPVVAALVACYATGCGTPRSEGEPTPGLSTAPTGQMTTTSTEGDTSTSITIGELGDRRNPIPLGQEARVGDWMVKVVGATMDATQAVLDENMFNDPPEAGSQYVLVGVEATYLGGESSTFWVDMMYTFVGRKGNTFDSGVAVAPDSIFDDGEVFTGGVIAGNLLFAVASDQAAGGTLMVEEAFSFDQSRVFFAVD